MISKFIEKFDLSFSRIHQSLNICPTRINILQKPVMQNRWNIDIYILNFKKSILNSVLFICSFYFNSFPRIAQLKDDIGLITYLNSSCKSLKKILKQNSTHHTKKFPDQKLQFRILNIQCCTLFDWPVSEGLFHFCFVLE